ncbi:hypothetical protein HMPREF0731_2666, partial [Pseudoroseomonas cervicalis ATCC 49957]
MRKIINEAQSRDGALSPENADDLHRLAPPRPAADRCDARRRGARRPRRRHG